MSQGVTAFFISFAALILGLAIAVFNKQMAQSTVQHYQKISYFRFFGPDYDERPLRVQNLIAGVAILAMGIAGIICARVAETGREVDSLKTIFILGTAFVVISTIVTQILWLGFVGKKTRR